MSKRIPIFWILFISFSIAIALSMGLDYLLSNIGILQSSPYLRIFVSFILSVIFSIIAAQIVLRVYIRPTIRKLNDGMNQLAQKNFDYRLEENDIDAFDKLAQNFNIMAVLLSSYESELVKARDFLNSILEGTADIIISVNARGKILSFNTGAEQALGYTRDEIIGQHIETIFVDISERNVALERLQYGDNVKNYETRFRTKDGEIKDVLLTLSLMRHPTGTFVGTFGISKDITDEKKLQKQLIQSQRLAAIGEVFMGIQHSLKNMLNTCRGGAYMVKTGLKKDDRKMFEEGWDIVQLGIDKMTEMTIDMLKYVREWKPKIESVDIGSLFTEVEKLVSKNTEGKGIGFSMEMPEGIPSVMCDPRMIHSVLMDLITNAIDACEWKDYDNTESPEISIRSYMNDNEQNAVLEVKDNGCGMTEEVKTNIFNPFFSTKSKAGTGLGLSITSRMIEVHKGRIDVDSEPDKGSVFRIFLPLDANGKH